MDLLFAVEKQSETRWLIRILEMTEKSNAGNTEGHLKVVARQACRNGPGRISKGGFDRSHVTWRMNSLLPSTKLFTKSRRRKKN
jgi:hypothetical protein